MGKPLGMLLKKLCSNCTCVYYAWRCMYSIQNATSSKLFGKKL